MVTMVTSHFLLCFIRSPFPRLLYYQRYTLSSTTALSYSQFMSVLGQLCSTSPCEWYFLGHGILSISGKAERLGKYLLPLETSAVSIYLVIFHWSQSQIFVLQTYSLTKGTSHRALSEVEGRWYRISQHENVKIICSLGQKGMSLTSEHAA